MHEEESVCLPKELQKMPPMHQGKFILTGSSQFKLRENMSDSLAGRASFLKLMPFSLLELQAENLLSEDAYETMIKGFYPPLRFVRLISSHKQSLSAAISTTV